MDGAGVASGAISRIIIHRFFLFSFGCCSPQGSCWPFFDDTWAH